MGLCVLQSILHRIIPDTKHNIASLPSAVCPVLAEEGVRSSPGHWTAIVLYLQQLFVLIGHLAVTRFV